MQKSACVEVIDAIQDNLPALYFVFSRGKTEWLAEELGREWDFLFPEEKKAVEDIIRDAEKINNNLFTGRRKNLRRLLLQGIGYHHAGLSPNLKEIVEKLYEIRLIFVLFCTETFAVGINFPAASTVFESTRKWDGESHRGLLNREFFQMAGRAGRRGYDPVGHVYIRIEEKSIEQTGFFNENEVEPVRGRLIISPNTVLSLLRWKTDDEIKKFLSQNLAVYQNSKEMRRAKTDIALIETRIKGLRQHFCSDKETPACPVLRKKLKKELNKLRRRGRRHRNYFPGRFQQIKSILSEETNNCMHIACIDAQREIKTLEEQRNNLLRWNKILSKQTTDYPREFDKMVKLLQRMGYIDGKNLLPRGNFALFVHVQELLVTELVFSGIIHEASEAETAAIIAGVDYYPGRDEVVLSGEYDMDEVVVLQNELAQMGVPEHLRTWSSVPGPLAEAWYNGATFEQLMSRCNLHEGDVFSILRREIDLLRQMERAAGEDRELKDKINKIRRTLDRDEVAVLL